jgi:LCP family protein required for cell wall assembly
MVLVSVDRRTGDTALVSVPRNLARLPMPEGVLRDKFPKGWTDIANAFYGYVQRNPSLGDGSDQAGANALKGALAEALGVPIDNYVLVDMGGFIDVIDALGGVELTLSKRIPSPGNPYEAKHGVPAFLGPGPVRLDGTTALAYARSREGDSDYRRMERQRCLLAAAARQVSPADLLRRYDDLLAAMDRSVRSDLTPGQAGTLIELYRKVDRTAIRSLGLVPPFVNTGAPNYAEVRELVAATLEPPAAVSPAPAAPAEDAPAAETPASGPPAADAPAGDSGPGTTTPATVFDETSAC